MSSQHREVEAEGLLFTIRRAILGYMVTLSQARKAAVSLVGYHLSLVSKSPHCQCICHSPRNWVLEAATGHEGSKVAKR